MGSLLRRSLRVMEETEKEEIRKKEEAKRNWVKLHEYLSEGFYQALNDLNYCCQGCEDAEKG